MNLQGRGRLILVLGALAVGAILLLAIGPGAGLQRRQSQATPTPGPSALLQEQVEQVLGLPGEMRPGDVLHFDLARTDLNVTVRSVNAAPELLAGFANFREANGQTLVTGEVPLLSLEVNPVMTRLLQNGFIITASHHHLFGTSPELVYLHLVGSGDAERLAAMLRQALEQSAMPLDVEQPGTPSPTPEDEVPPEASAWEMGVWAADVAQEPTPTLAPDFDGGEIVRILGRSGRVLDGGVLEVAAPRQAAIRLLGTPVPPAMGVQSVLRFQPANGQAAASGAFALTANEVSPVARTLRDNGIEVMAIANYWLDEQPRLFYLHFWALGEPQELARTLRMALEQTDAAQAGEATE